GGTQNFDTKGNQLHNLILAGHNVIVDLQSELKLTGLLSFAGNEAVLNSNGFLTLKSSSVDGLGNGCVGPLGEFNMLTGTVSVERFMDAGRIYRYISSPVKNA